MTQSFHPALGPLTTRWTTFLENVRARVQKIEGEATAAYAEVSSYDVVDGTGLSGVSSVLRARLIALRQKVDDAWDTIDGEADKLDLEDSRSISCWRGQMLALRSAFTRQLEIETERILVKGEAAAARKLHAAALAEIAVAVPCQHCGAELDRRGTAWHTVVNLTCPHCQAITTATPGTAAQMFAMGLGAISLARESAWPQWLAMQDAEAQWHDLRHKTLDDLARWEAANRAYWQAYADAMGRLHPGWTPQHVANEVTGKMSSFMEYTATDDRAVRETNQVGMNAAASGDPARLAHWLDAQRDREGAAQMLIEASIERGWREQATWIAQIAAPLLQQRGSG